MGKKISFISYLSFRFGVAVMAFAIAYQFILGGVTLRMIKFPLIGGEIQFEKKEKLPKGTVKLALNEAKYIFDGNFILRVRPTTRGDQDDNSFNVSFYGITASTSDKYVKSYRSGYVMTPGDEFSIEVDSLWYHVRMLRIKKDDDNRFCYFDLYTSTQEKPE